MPTSVVTGGAGFLGSHLCDALLEQGHRVICVDNLETGSLANIEHKRSDEFVFVPHDLTHADPDRGAGRLRLPPREPGEPDRLPAAAAADAEGRLHGTHNALGLAKFKRARFLLASTSEVYGDPQVHPQPETYWGHVNPIGPRGVYDEAKRYAEALTMAYHRQQGVDTAIVRIFNTYGPRMRPHDGRAIPTFIRQAMEREAAHRLRRRLADTELLLRRRPHPRPDRARRERRAHAGQHRQPAGVHPPRAGREGDRGLGRRQRDRPRGAAGRRSEGAPARHHPRAAAARLGARGLARRGAARLHSALRGSLRLSRRLLAAGGSSLAATARSACPRRARRAIIQLGIFDDTQFNYGNPDQGLPGAEAAADAGDPGQPRLGRAERRRQATAREPDEPERSGLRLGGLRPHGAVRAAERDQGRLLDRRDAAVGERRRGRQRRARRTRSTSSASRPPRRGATAARSGAGRADPPAGAPAGSPGTSRTTRPSCGRSTARSTARP